jgi:hypothetical protein
MSALVRTRNQCDLLSVARLSCALHGCLVFTEIDEGCREPCPVGDAREKQLRGLVQFVLEAFLSYFKNIGDISHGEEVLHVVQSVGLCVSVGELGVHLWLPQGLASHLQEADKVVVLAGVVGDFDNFNEVRGIFSLDIRI